jgi:hypothetical protein
MLTGHPERCLVFDFGGTGGNNSKITCKTQVIEEEFLLHIRQVLCRATNARKPVLGEDGRPMHDRGVVTKVPGLYFVGLHFLYAMTSATLTGVGRDAERIVRAINHRARVARPVTEQNLKRSELAVEHR